MLQLNYFLLFFMSFGNFVLINMSNSCKYCLLLYVALQACQNKTIYGVTIVTELF